MRHSSIFVKNLLLKGACYVYYVIIMLGLLPVEWPLNSTSRHVTVFYLIPVVIQPGVQSCWSRQVGELIKECSYTII